MTKDKEALTITKGLATGISDYINGFEVYLIDLEGHGKSSPLKESYSSHLLQKTLMR